MVDAMANIDDRLLMKPKHFTFILNRLGSIRDLIIIMQQEEDFSLFQTMGSCVRFLEIIRLYKGM